MNGAAQDESVPAVEQAKDQESEKSFNGAKEESSSSLSPVAAKDDAIVPVETATRAAADEEQPVIFALMNDNVEGAEDEEDEDDQGTSKGDDNGDETTSRNGTDGKQPIEQESVAKEDGKSNASEDVPMETDSTEEAGVVSEGTAAEASIPQQETSSKGKTNERKGAPAPSKAKGDTGNRSQTTAAERSSGTTQSSTSQADGDTAATDGEQPTTMNTRRSLRHSNLKRSSEPIEKPAPAKRMATDEVKSQARVSWCGFNRNCIHLKGRSNLVP